jgi:N-acyl-D-amino-acid deacylase
VDACADIRPYEESLANGSSLWATGPLSVGKPHPRSYGTNPRVLGHFVRERRLLSLEEAIRKMTLLPASRLGLTQRGRITPGFAADRAVFDPATIADTAAWAKTLTFTTPGPSPMRHCPCVLHFEGLRKEEREHRGVCIDALTVM